MAVPAAQRTALVAALQALEQQGMRIQLVDSGNEPGCPARTTRLSLVGNDRPGIVRHHPAAGRAGHQPGSLRTEDEPAPMSREPLFHAEALLALPAELALARLQERLRRWLTI